MRYALSLACLLAIVSMAHAQILPRNRANCAGAKAAACSGAAKQASNCAGAKPAVAHPAVPPAVPKPAKVAPVYPAQPAVAVVVIAAARPGVLSRHKDRKDQRLEARAECR